MPAVIRGAFPVEILDRPELWVDPAGRAHRVADIQDREVILWGLDYLLANSRFLREAWTAKTKQTYDTEQRSRRWMLDKPLVRSLMRQLVALDHKQEVQEAYDKSRMEQSQPSGPVGVRPISPPAQTNTLSLRRG